MKPLDRPFLSFGNKLMKRILILILFVTTPMVSVSQNMKTIKQLNDSIKSVKDDKIKAALLMDVSYYWAEFNYDSSWHYVLLAEQIVQELGDKKLIRRVINAKGLVYDYQNQMDSAIFYYNKAGDYAEKMNDLEGIASALINIGVVYHYNGQMEDAIDAYQNALEKVVTNGDSVRMAMVYNNLGVVYRVMENYELAQHHYENAIEIKEAIGDRASSLNSMQNLVIVLQKLQAFDEAIVMSERAMKLAEELSDPDHYLHALVNLGNSYRSKGNDSEALINFIKANELISEGSSYLSRVHTYQSLSELFIESERFREALPHVDALRDLTDDGKGVEYLRNAYLLSSKVYTGLGMYQQALNFLEIAYENQKELFDNDVKVKTTELEKLYEKEKREAEIARLNIVNELSAKERNVLIISLGLILVIAVLLYFMLSQKKKSSKEKDLLLNEKSTLLNEIHHRIKNNLQMISSLLNLQAESLTDKSAVTAMNEGQARVKSMGLIHQKLYSKDDVRGVGIQDYFESLIAELFIVFGVDGEQVKYKVATSDIRLDIETLIPLGLIANELITNSIKYAFPDSQKGILEVSMKELENKLYVEVRDNGVGMDESAMVNSNAFGWMLIQSLVDQLDADINISKKSGTVVQIVLSNYKLVS